MISDKLFDELKQASIEVWETYDDTYGYASEKINYVKSLTNVGDNYGTFIGMFDVHNQEKLYHKVGDESKALIDSWTGGLERSIQMAKEMGIY